LASCRRYNRTSLAAQFVVSMLNRHSRAWATAQVRFNLLIINPHCIKLR